MTNTVTPTFLQAPSVAMLKDDSSHYRFLLGLYNRTGGSKSTSDPTKVLTAIVTGLTASVNELNTLNGMNVGQPVQNQLDNKVSYAVIYDPSSPITTPPNVVISAGVICHDMTSNGSVGVVETNLINFYLLANTLINDYAFIEVTGFGSFAANANNKRLKLKLGSTVLYDSTALALNDGYWKVDCTIVRTSATTQKCIVNVNSSNLTLPKIVNYVVGAEDLTTQLNVLFTGTGVVNNDIIQEGLIIKYYKA